jgi:putative selenate reductase
MELLAPISFVNGTLTCEVMRLGEYDKSGRRGIEGTGEKRELSFDTVIGAVGSRVDTEHFTRNGITLDEKGFPKTSVGGETNLSGIYIAGDCKAGPATVVKAIACGKAAAADILKKLGLEADFLVESVSTNGYNKAHSELSDLYLKKGIILNAKHDHTEGHRCLSCNTLCEICVDVCPNRANVMIEMKADSFETHQIVHIDRICNECGNCATFCPHPGKPYRDKLTIFSCTEDFNDSENPGLLKTGKDSFQIRLEDKSVVNYSGKADIPAQLLAIIETIEKKYGYLLEASCS